ncbi:exosome complex RNA-binding protein Rrp4 [Palaeococcus ferrophilus]|uniref:exosome complex RNA-binding protein Rrp4 n=1 Tax=Palaeococcus ferrophilus TaxID=83868 RepID=UPI00064EE45D|nr:exosome complex RNA-binding protein Rrp4 [Palaeococcus ferrophilus]
MKKVFVNSKELVVPGTLIAQGPFKAGKGTFREGNRVYAAVIGLVEVRNDLVRVIPLEGPYIPEVGDNVIGMIVDVRFSNWAVDIGAPYQAGLRVQDATDERIDLAKTDLRRIFDIGDIIYARVKAFNEINQIDLTTKGMPFRGGPLRGGQLVTITPSKVPRLIGKGGSMINMIKSLTRTRIVVGQNGWVWVSGKEKELEKVAIEAIIKVNRESHTQGLTDRVKEYIIGRLQELKEQGVIEEVPQIEGGEGE